MGTHEPAGPDEPGARARERAREAAERAAAARERVDELARHAGDRDEAELSAQRQAQHTRDALRHSVEGHERTARTHDDAAAFEEARGNHERAVEHRAAAERGRRLAREDRDRLSEAADAPGPREGEESG